MIPKNNSINNSQVANNATTSMPEQVKIKLTPYNFMFKLIEISLNKPDKNGVVYKVVNIDWTCKKAFLDQYPETPIVKSYINKAGKNIEYEFYPIFEGTLDKLAADEKIFRARRFVGLFANRQVEGNSRTPKPNPLKVAALSYFK
jgi:hypothetical protein